jgi:hypothetical protein
MLDTYPWYIVYGCYGSLLEEHIYDIGIYFRFILWYDACLRYIVVHGLDT